jgi:hypothetical protein
VTAQQDWQDLTLSQQHGVLQLQAKEMMERG